MRIVKAYENILSWFLIQFWKNVFEFFGPEFVWQGWSEN